MIVYKFGGASVKDASAIKKLKSIILRADQPLIIVISALGKTTNELENVLNAKFELNEGYIELLNKIRAYHYKVIDDLEIPGQELSVYIDKIYNDLLDLLQTEIISDFDLFYDKLVSCGELWSTKIIAEWLKLNSIECQWVDIRKVLLTDNRYRDANVNWEKSADQMHKTFNFKETGVYVTQGFIAASESGMSTTLGREGSDYSAAIIANLMDAEILEIWKDVPGILNADPKWMPDAVLLESLNYKEAVEMSFSGAKVIHPKTIKPLHNKGIPLIVRSFIDPFSSGTLISDEGSRTDIPVYIRKERQILISILPRDFSLVISDSLGTIFSLFYSYGIKVNLIQASAVSIAVCIDDESKKMFDLVEKLEKDFKVIYNDGVEMLTVRQYSPEAIEKICRGCEILVEQKTRRTIRMVVRSD